MTAFNYARSRATAERLIAKFGQPATINRAVNSGTSYDPNQSITAYPCTVAVMAYSNSEIDGTLIRRGDKRLYVSTAGLVIEPTNADTITIGGVRHEIVQVDPLSPAGTVVFWEIQARI